MSEHDVALLKEYKQYVANICKNLKDKQVAKSLVSYYEKFVSCEIPYTLFDELSLKDEEIEGNSDVSTIS